MSDTNPSPYSPPGIDKRVPKPPGVLPRHAQAWVIGGISLLMVVVIAFSGRNAPKERTASTLPAPSTVVDPNDARIQDYRARIEEQARKLAAEQALLSQVKQTVGRGSTNVSAVGDGQTVRGTAASEDWIAADKKKRDYVSLFDSSLALSHRDVSERGSHTSKPSGDPRSQENASRDRSSGPDIPNTSVQPADPAQSPPKTYRIFEGTVIETVLTNRLDGTFSGPVNCMVTTALYSHDRQRLLIPQGSRVFGEVRPVESLGQQRLAVTFHRLLMPDGYAVNLDTLPGLNQIGETGLLDHVSHHYLQVFGVSLAIGAIAGLSQASTRYGSEATPADTYRQGVASSLSQSSLAILDRYLNVLPTFTIREGHRVKVYLTGDLSVPAYTAHQMPGDL